MDLRESASVPCVFPPLPSLGSHYRATATRASAHGWVPTGPPRVFSRSAVRATFSSLGRHPLRGPTPILPILQRLPSRGPDRPHRPDPPRVYHPPPCPCRGATATRRAPTHRHGALLVPIPPFPPFSRGPGVLWRRYANVPTASPPSSAIQLCRSCHIFPPLPSCLREALFKPSFIVVPGFPSLSLSFPFISNASANSRKHKFSDGSRPPRSVFSPRHTNSPDTLTSLPLPLRHTPNFPRLFGGLNTP